MMRRLPLVLVMALAVVPAFAQDDEQPWLIYTSEGAEVAFEEVIGAAAGADVLLVGELHDDTTAHLFQRALLEELDRSAGDRHLVLSMEMFERDVQLVVDEYLAGLITEQHFLSSTRPWPNYRRDYQPLVEYARDHELPVIAANPPRRYVNLVAREGMAALDLLPAASSEYLPPLPLPEASEDYRSHFRARMSEMQAHGEEGGPSPGNLLQAQLLWDAGMADAIAQFLDRDPTALVLHIAGSFHVEEEAGIEDMLTVYRPEARTLSVVLRPDARFNAEAHAALADFLVLTAPE